MAVIVVGAGKLAAELLSSLQTGYSREVIAWADTTQAKGCAVVVHAGSGRELEDVIAYCNETGSTLVELATGSEMENRDVNFPVILCPNTNVLMLKFMAMLSRSGHHFTNYKIGILESHQAGKSSTPGTAVSLAQSLDVARDDIVSIRDPLVQKETLNIPPEYISRHAYHRIEIADGLNSVVLETSVLGPAPYAEGLARIISAIESNALENRRYHIVEFVENGWI